MQNCLGQYLTSGVSLWCCLCRQLTGFWNRAVDFRKVCICMYLSLIVCLPDLISVPQQVKTAIVDRGTEKVHPMVSDTEVQITKPEDHPGRRNNSKMRTTLVFSDA